MVVHTFKKRTVEAVFKDALGRVVPAPDGVSFSIAHGAVASIGVTSATTAVITAVSPGDTEVQAGSAGLSAAEPVSVLDLPLGPPVSMELVFGPEEDA